MSRSTTLLSRTPTRKVTSVPQVEGPPAVIVWTISAMLACGGTR